MNDNKMSFWEIFLLLLLTAFGVVSFIVGVGTSNIIFATIGIVLVGFSLWFSANLIYEWLQKITKNNKDENTKVKEIGCAPFMWVMIIAIIIAFFTMCSSGNDNKYDVVYDEDGFLGYSDSFWDWWGDQ